MVDSDREREGLKLANGVWNRISDIYLREIDRRFVPVVEAAIARAVLTPGEHVLDLGTGTGAVAQQAAKLVSPGGQVTGVDISLEMLAVARRRTDALGLSNVTLLEGRAENIPADDDAFDAVLACLSLMYVIDRQLGSPRDLPSPASRRTPCCCGLGRPRAVRHRALSANRRPFCWSSTRARRGSGSVGGPECFSSATVRRCNRSHRRDGDPGI